MDQRDDSAPPGLAATPQLMTTMAALEEWLADGHPTEDRLFAVSFEGGAWHAWLSTATTLTDHTGRTMADALAQAAQVAVSDPTLAGAS